ncbi:hypothetical protein MLD38_017197 [Melastoma candidum]|uniref:Uncharacterized protein n=1 Tax=Melastoma candidum TaxID=119954 RepID=A0ACB9QR09_9MYRT|nr:hypothetical protein MLD38_017197 [Melastoma candidum]
MRVRSEDNFGQKKIQKIRKSAACDDEGSDEGDIAFKKGPWTATEDAILMDYVQKHGEGNWNTVQKNSGLSRCGKSCRLRWTNHLRPDLKKGTFSEEEEHRIIELHAKYGNKWARMATELPGRTDNEIKNFWNTRIKRLQRAGKPIYPSDICPEHLAENGEFGMLDVHPAGSNHSDLLQESKFEIPLPDIDLEKLRGSQSYPCLLSSLHKVPSLCSPKGNCLSDSCNVPIHLMPPLKRFRLADETSFPCVNGHERCDIPPISQFACSPEFPVQPLLVPPPQSSQLSYTNAFGQPYLGVVTGNHAIRNGNFHSLEFSIEALKMELPSLQYPDARLNSRSTPLSSLRSIGRANDLYPVPPINQCQPDQFSSGGCTGLLEDIIYKPISSQNPEQGCHPQTKENFSMVPNPDSSFGHSSHLESSPDEHQSFVTDADIFDVLNEVEESEEIDSSRPDVILNSSWFGQKF